MNGDWIDDKIESWVAKSDSIGDKKQREFFVPPRHAEQRKETRATRGIEAKSPGYGLDRGTRRMKPV